jgi:4-hydroxybenzoate polyprenyltransferase
VSAPASDAMLQPPPANGLSSKLICLAKDIRLSHTIFALPFALLSTFLAAKGMPKWGQLGLILICMVTARSMAMAMNRLLDARLDALNPRTRLRALPSGQLSPAFVITAVAICAGLFIAATALFKFVYANPWPLRLSGLVLVYISSYPFLKRFTRLCHYYLGIALGLAPICAWVAIAGRLAMPPIWMGIAVTLWTAGFDIIYACQDYQSDVEHCLFSVPAKMGIGPALLIARLTHVLCLATLVMIGVSASLLLGTVYFIGVGLAGLLMVIEHSLVHPNDLSKVGLAFFTINGVISVLLGTLGIIDIFLR